MQNPSLLTDRQRSELNRTILAYLRYNNVPNEVVKGINHVLNGDSPDNAFPRQIGYLENADEENQDFEDKDENEVARRHEQEQLETKKLAQVLEKKWTSVVRLQRKVLDLESQVSNLSQELENMPVLAAGRRGAGGRGANGLGSAVDPVSWLPRAPAKFSLSGHRQPITAVAFHAVYSVLASASEDGTIKIWDWELGELERTIKGHTKAVLDVDFGGREANSDGNGSSSTSGYLLASCSSDLTIKLWDPENDYANIRTLTGHEHTISSVRFTPSGAHLVSASRDQTVRIWEVKTGFAVRTIKAHTAWVKCVVPTWDSQYVISGSIDQTARISSIVTGETKLTLTGHEHVVECAAFAPVTAHANLAALEGVRAPVASTLSPSFEYAATGSRDKTIRLWNTRGELIATLRGHDNWVRGLAFHPGGRYLLSVSDDRSIRCWDLTQKGRCAKVLADAHHHFISCIRWAPPISSANDSAETASSGSLQYSPTRTRVSPSKLSLGKPRIANSSTGLAMGGISRALSRHNTPAQRSTSGSGASGILGSGVGGSRRVFSNGTGGLRDIYGTPSVPAGPNTSTSTSTTTESSTTGDDTTAPETSGTNLPAAVLRGMRCVIATGSVDLDIKIWM